MEWWGRQTVWGRMPVGVGGRGRAIVRNYGRWNGAAVCQKKKKREGIVSAQLAGQGAKSRWFGGTG